MSKHTPGPWTVYTWEGSEDEAHGFSICAGGYLLPLSDATGDMDEAEANARLIAAAPELYEALKECARVLSDLPSTNQAGTRTRATWERARAALAKVDQ